MVEAGNKERRTARRYALALPIELRSTRRKNAEPLRATTRDISVRGIYFISERELAEDSEVDCTFALPAQLTQGTEVFVKARGRVVRIEKKRGEGPQGVGLAVDIQTLEFVRTHNPTVNE